MTDTFTLSIISHDYGAMLHALLDDTAAFDDARDDHVVVTLNLPMEKLDVHL